MNTSSDPPLMNLAVLISGGGRTLGNLIEHSQKGAIPGRIAVVIVSRENLKGIAIARSAGLVVEVLDPRQYDDVAEFSARLVDILERYNIDLVCQAGWLCYWRLPERWMGCVLNIHPSLLPAYGGKGFYGLRVHRAVLAAGETLTGCTVHLVNNEYDAGEILLQRTVPVEPGDNPDTLAQRVFREECIAYPQAIRTYYQSWIKNKWS